MEIGGYRGSKFKLKTHKLHLFRSAPCAQMLLQKSTAYSLVSHEVCENINWIIELRSMSICSLTVSTKADCKLKKLPPRKRLH